MAAFLSFAVGVWWTYAEPLSNIYTEVAPPNARFPSFHFQAVATQDEMGRTLSPKSGSRADEPRTSVRIPAPPMTDDISQVENHQPPVFFNVRDPGSPRRTPILADETNELKRTF